MVLVATQEGVKKVNCNKRLPEGQASDRELVLAIKGMPWKLSPSAESQTVPDDVPTMVATEPIAEEEGLLP
eukprot:1423628-Karenia_brevis.AAC.1